MTDGMRLMVSVGVLACSAVGWSLAGHLGAGIGLIIGLVLLVIRWRRQPLWSWAALFLRRNRPMDLVEPSTVANDRSGGAVRYQDGVAVAAIQVLGRPYRPTHVTGSLTAATTNSLEVIDLVSAMRHGLGLRLDSISVVTTGSRRRSSGDYPRVYDTFIGTTPYAGQRETWLIIRLGALDNGDALRWRPTVGTAALAAAQRIAMVLRSSGVRTKVATATDIVDLEKRLGASALEPRNRRWHSVRGNMAWQTSYALRADEISSGLLDQVWTLRADGIIQNITIFPDGTCSAMVTVCAAQPPTASPSVTLQTLPGEQVKAAAAVFCGPLPEIRGLTRRPLPAALTVPIGPSGVLLGKTGTGERLLLPLGDPAEQTRIHIAAEDAIAKRIIIRIVAAGDRVTVHSAHVDRWETIRMPNLAVIEHPRPVTGTTVSVVDGTVAPAPRPGTVISVGPAGTATEAGVDVVIAQTGPQTIEVTVEDRRYVVEMEFFRAENRYLSNLELVD